MSLFQITATQRDVERKLDVLHFIACQGLRECVAFDASLGADFSAIADRIDALKIKVAESPRCAECDCAMGGEDCNWIESKERAE